MALKLPSGYQQPDIAYTAFGRFLLIAELFNPGTIFLGLSADSLLVGFYSLGVLNAYWEGIVDNPCLDFWWRTWSSPATEF